MCRLSIAYLQRPRWLLHELYSPLKEVWMNLNFEARKRIKNMGDLACEIIIFTTFA